MRLNDLDYFTFPKRNLQEEYQKQEMNQNYKFTRVKLKASKNIMIESLKNYVMLYKQNLVKFPEAISLLNFVR